MNSKDSTNNLAIIGASGAGKTTLAVGLYATSTKTFSVADHLSDETRKYLEIRKTSIQEHFWPAATNESENFDLHLALHAAGTETDIVFREYMGERLDRDPNYIREVIGKPKSAMILFNPGMPGLDKPEARNRMIGNLKKIAQHLKDNQCIAVAFVVTASDRLSTDLKDFREDFEAYASEVTNHLTNLRLNWKRFDVTVSGQLEDQNEPTLARGENNTTHKPFLWLLGCIKHHEFLMRVKVAAATAAVLLAVAGATFGGLVVGSRSKLARAEAELGKCLATLNASYANQDEAEIRTNAKFLETNAFERLSAILPSDRVRKENLIAFTKGQKELWGIRLLATEFTLTTNKLAEKPLLVPLTWFSGFDKRVNIAPSSADAVTERDTLAKEWENSRIGLETLCQTAHFRDKVEKEYKNLASAKEKDIVEPLKVSLALLMDEDNNYSHVTNRSELCVDLLKARTSAIAEYVASKTSWKATDPTPPGEAKNLVLEIRQKLKNALSSDEFENLKTIVEQRRNNARRAWDAYQFPKRTSELETALKGAGSNPARPLKESLLFLVTMTNDYPTISQAEFITTRASIAQARKTALAAYADSIAKWDVNGRKPPEFDSKKIRETVLTSTVVTDDEAAAFDHDMQKRFSSANEDWKKKQKKRVNDFAVGVDPETMVRNYGEFCDEWPNNPYLGDLCGIIDGALQKYFRKFLSEYSELVSGSKGKKPVALDQHPKQRMVEAQLSFNKFVAICRALNGDGLNGNRILNEPSGKFAKLCCDKGLVSDTKRGIDSMFPQTLRITKIEALTTIDKAASSFLGLDLAVKFRTERWNYSNATWETTDEFSPVNMKSKTCSGESGNLPKSRNEEWVTLWTGSKEFLVYPYTMTRIDCSFEDRLTALWSMDVDDAFYWYPYLGDKSCETEWSIRLRHSSHDDTVGKLQLRVTAKRNGPNFWTLAQEAGINP